MELTATNRSQAYPKAENGKHFWKYPLYDSFRSKVGLKKFKKDLQLSDECSMILYVVLKARDVLINKICFHDIPR